MPLKEICRVGTGVQSGSCLAFVVPPHSLLPYLVYRPLFGIPAEVQPITLPKLADGSLCRGPAMVWNTLLVYCWTTHVDNMSTVRALEYACAAYFV